MIEKKFANLPVAYAQMVVFDSELDRPFNDWTSEHTDQGFSLRDSSVSFALDERVLEVEIFVNEKVFPIESSYKCIRVPLHVNGHSGISIGTLIEQHNVNISSGSYVIVFSAMETKEKNIDIVNIGIHAGRSHPAVLINDGSIVRTSDFVMTADPA